jgi:anti-sigma factor RsiW
MSATLNPRKRHQEHCREVRAHMSEYLDDELDERDAARVARHVRWCPSCHRMLANLTRTIGGLRALRDRPTPVDGPRRVA